MTIHVPKDVRALLDRERVREAKDRRAERIRERAHAHELSRARAAKRKLAREALAWARALARRCDLPAGGIEIFASGSGRVSTTVLVLPGGALEFRHVVAPFAAFRIVGRKADKFDGVPLDVLAEVVAVTRTDAVWECVREGTATGRTQIS